MCDCGRVCDRIFVAYVSDSDTTAIQSNPRLQPPQPERTSTEACGRPLTQQPSHFSAISPHSTTLQKCRWAIVTKSLFESFSLGGDDAGGVDLVPAWFPIGQGHFRVFSNGHLPTELLTNLKYFQTGP